MIACGSLSVAFQEYKIALEFAKKGHVVYLICNKPNSHFEVGKLEKHENLKTIEIPHSSYKYDLLDINDKIDVCLGMDQSVSPFVAEYQERRKVPGYCMFLDMPIHAIDGRDLDNYNSKYSQSYYYWINCALSLTGVIFNNSVAVDEFKKRYKRDAHLVFYSVTQDDALSSFEAPPTKDYVFGCNRIIPYKRVDLAVEAIIKTPYDYKHVFISGDKSEMDKINDLAPEADNKFVFYQGVSEDKKMEFFYNAKLVVYTQMVKWIGGLSILEGMSVKTPGVCFDYPALRELYGDCALYAEPGNVDQLSKAITDLYEDDDLNADVAERGYARFQQYFTREVMADNLLEVIKNGK